MSELKEINKQVRVLICEVCRKEFTNKRNKGKTCSKECLSKFKKDAKNDAKAKELAQEMEAMCENCAFKKEHAILQNHLEVKKSQLKSVQEANIEWSNSHKELKEKHNKLKAEHIQLKVDYEELQESHSIGKKQKEIMYADMIRISEDGSRAVAKYEELKNELKTLQNRSFWQRVWNK